MTAGPGLSGRQTSGKITTPEFPKRAGAGALGSGGRAGSEPVLTCGNVGAARD